MGQLGEKNLSDIKLAEYLRRKTPQGFVPCVKEASANLRLVKGPKGALIGPRTITSFNNLLAILCRQKRGKFRSWLANRRQRVVLLVNANQSIIMA